jgi:hypothetical protein
MSKLDRLEKAVRNMILTGFEQAPGFMHEARQFNGSLPVQVAPGRTLLLTISVKPLSNIDVEVHLEGPDEIGDVPPNQIVRQVLTWFRAHRTRWSMAFAPRVRRVAPNLLTWGPLDPLEAKTQLMARYGVNTVGDLARVIRNIVCAEVAQMMCRAVLRTTPDKVWPGGLAEGARFVFDVLSRTPDLPCFLEWGLRQRFKDDSRTSRAMPVAFLPNGLVRYATSGPKGRVRFSDHVLMQKAPKDSNGNKCLDLFPFRYNLPSTSAGVSFAIHVRDVAEENFHTGKYGPQPEDFTTRCMDAVRFGRYWAMLYQKTCPVFVRSEVPL